MGLFVYGGKMIKEKKSAEEMAVEWFCSFHEWGGFAECSHYGVFQGKGMVYLVDGGDSYDNEVRSLTCYETIDIIDLYKRYLKIENDEDFDVFGFVYDELEKIEKTLP